MTSGTAAQIEALTVGLRDAEAACAAKDAFIAAISRELNNPLAPVLLAVEHLRAVLPNGEAPRIHAAMRLLERATEEFARRTRVLLDLADLTSGAVPLAIGPVDVSALLASVAAAHGETARLAGCTITLAVPPGLVASGNTEALQQVLGHVLANAFRYGAGRPVRLDANVDAAGAVMIGISDQGPGIAAGKAERLFALLQHTRAPLEPGLGIGLWVTAQLMAAMGGSIEAENTNGAHFHVKLPLA